MADATIHTGSDEQLTADRPGQTERERQERADRIQLELDDESKKRAATIHTFRQQTQRLKEQLASRRVQASPATDTSPSITGTDPGPGARTPSPLEGAPPTYAPLGVFGEVLRVVGVISSVVGLIGFIVALTTGTQNGLVACAILGFGLVGGLLMYAGGLLLHAVRDMAINSWHLRIASNKSARS